MKFSKSIILSLSSAILLALPYAASATNGYFLIGFGAKSRAMGGTGVANNTRGMAAAFNPATMIESGNVFDIGAELFIPPRAISHNSGVLGYTDERSNHDLFLIPSMGGTYQYNDKMALGFAFIGAGLKTEYNQTVNSDSCNAVNAGSIPGYSSCPPTVFNYAGSAAGTEAGVELTQMQLLPSIAYKVHKNHTLGATLVIGYQLFRAEGLQAFEDLGFTSNPGNMTDMGWERSLGGGYRLGWLGNFMDDKLKVGVNYSSRVWMEQFERYENLFAEQGDFDIPENYSFGIAYDFTPKWTGTFDIQQINYSEVRSVANPGPSVNAPTTGNLFPLCPDVTDNDSCKLGGTNGLGFGWVDQTIYKIGVDWTISEKWNARAGWNYAESPIQEDQVLFNMMAPATPEHHLTLGGGYYFTENVVLDANLMIAFLNTIKGPTPFAPGGAQVVGSNASIAMGQYSLGATLGIKF